ncbi:MAG: hypothetical protein KAV82_01450 [Phycisphaerae bacterium]|nr:hypothetical protein [Phycisphaerae bacterium]
MTDGLLAINLFVRAFDEVDPRAALRKAFDRIAAWDHDPSRRYDYRALLRFLVEVRRASEPSSYDSTSPFLYDVARLFMERAIGTPEDIPASHANRPVPCRTRQLFEWHQAWSEIRDMARRPAVQEIALQRSNRVLATVRLDDAFTTKVVSNVTPGRYRLVLETGCVLWKASLDDRDLVWSRAFPNRPIQLAATTVQDAWPPTRDVAVFEGRLRIRVFPGVEAGTIAILCDGRGS